MNPSEAVSELRALCREPAVEIRRRLLAREVSAVEVVQAHLEVVERCNPEINAIVTLLPEQALQSAAAADRALARGEPLGPLHGLIVAHKDSTETAGIRTTYGSPVFADHVPDRDALIVERMRAAGAITIGKTNIPEWATGSNCVNPVFGATRNPFDPRLTPGGSSGGAAAALACGMVALADGSDMGGSLRIPASFCNVVGLRPSPGRVPSWPSTLPWSTLAVHGPMGRTVADVALMLSAVAGRDDRSPISLGDPPHRFGEPLDGDLHGVRVAWSRTLGGVAVEPAVTAVLESRRDVLSGIGCEVIDVEPNFSGAELAFTTWRAWGFDTQLGELLDRSPELVGANVTWNIELGRTLSARDLARAEVARGELYERMRSFMAEHEFLLAPVVQVPPFPVELDHPVEVAGERMETYIDWMRSCWLISATGLPAISVPCGFTDEGLPVGLQIVGRHRDDLGVLQLAHAFEAATQQWRRAPAIV
ncbi:MAG: amidase [Solirubrobacteraceae bacterium]